MKKKYSKRVLSLLLTVIMIVSIIPMGIVQSSAAAKPWLTMYEYSSSDYSMVSNRNEMQLYKGGLLGLSEKEGTYSCTKTPNLTFTNSVGTKFTFPKSGNYEIKGNFIYFPATFDGAVYEIKAKLHYDGNRIVKYDSFSLRIVDERYALTTRPDRIQNRTYYKLYASITVTAPQYTSGNTTAVNPPAATSPVAASSSSNSYKSSSYYRNLCNVALTGNQREDIVRIAESQIGYRSSAYGSGNYSGNVSSGVEDGCNEYSRYLGKPAGGAWCADFVSWCARMANIPTYIINSTGWASPDHFGISYNWSRAKGGSYIPRRGDLIFFNWNGYSGWSHVGVVSSVDGNNVTYVDGNGGTVDVHVRTKTVSLGWSEIKAYGIPNYQNNQLTPPAAPSISLPNQEIALDHNVIVNWNSISNADSYEIITDKGTVATGLGKGTTSYAINADTLNNHWVKVVAVNKAGRAESAPGYFTVHPPVKVTFMNWDGTVNEYQDVDYGEKPVAPSDVPEREGYTFNGWDGVDNVVYADTTINAKYTRNRYLVNFYKYVKNADGTRSTVQLGETQKVWYGEDAVAPGASTFGLETGHVFAGWSDSIENIKENKNIYLVDKWYNDNMSVLVSDLVAMRDDDGTGYTVTLKVTNNDTTLTSGRVIVALKTSEEKLVETTESSAFSIKAGASKELEIFIPSTKAASIVDAFAVEKFETAIPISITQRANIHVNESNLWTDWSTEAPPADALNSQAKSQYRSRAKQFTNSGISNLEGFEGKSRVLVDTTYSPWRLDYQGFIAKSNDNDFEYERSEDTRTAFKYYTWWSTGSQLFWYEKTYGNVDYNRYYEFYSSASGAIDGYDPPYNIPYVRTNPTLTVGVNDPSIGEVYCIRESYAGLGYVNQFVAGSKNRALPYPNGTSTVYRVKTQKYQYQYWKWNDWTNWTDNALNPIELLFGNKQQETREVYRYVPKTALGIEDNSGVQRNISGTLSADYAGQQATLFVYKYDEASDWTNEYVGQCEIASDGTYNFDFILRDEPTVKTGDYKVTLGIEGTDMVLNLAPIKAPVEQFTVNYYNTDGTIIDTQTVNKGDSAIIPAIIPVKEGYTFTGWSESNTAVKENLDIFPIMQINTYDVVFIDWEHQTYEMRHFNYGDALEGPVVPDTEDKAFAGWDVVNNGKTLVTENMVACAQFETKTFNVKFYDWDGNEIVSETVEYGSSLEAPDLDELGLYIFDGWSTYDFCYVTDNLDVYPTFHFENSVEDPTASVETGVYSEVQTVTLACDTEDAEIYYTTDGSDPAENGALYTAPLAITKSTTLKFVAKKSECNDSNTITKCYAINKEDMDSEWMTYSQLPQEVIDNPAEYTIVSGTGYKYKDTISTTSVSLKEQLLADGWTLDSTGWTDYSEYSETYPEFPDNEIEIQSRDADLVEKQFYNYSHYKYTDAQTGNAVCTAAEVAGTTGETETIKLENALTVSQFIDSAPAYSYNGELWFNQTITTEMVDPGYDVYSYRSKTFNLYKWTEWTVTAPSSGDERERQTDTVFKYIIPNEYVVTIDYSASEFNEKPNEVMLVKEGKTLNLAENYFEVEGYVFDGLFTNAEFTNAWNITSDTVSQSITIYPKHTMKTFKVRFLDYDGSVISDQTVQYLHFSEIPEDPQRDGYVFINWEVTAGSESGNDGVTSNVDYTARYVAEEDYVTVSLSRSKLSMMTGSTAKLTVKLSSESTANSEVYIYSSNPEIATVDQDGTVTAVHSGTAVITALSLDTYESANCIVTVLGSADTEILPISGSGLTVDPSAKLLLGITKDNNTLEEINNSLENDNLIYTNHDGSVEYNESNGSQHMGTGFQVIFKDNGFFIDGVEIVVYGDINGDGAVDAFDLFNSDKVINDLINLSGSYFAAADLDGDGSISLSDYICLIDELH